MGLIYVNPEGVQGDPVPENSVAHIRATFNRMVSRQGYRIRVCSAAVKLRNHPNVGPGSIGCHPIGLAIQPAAQEGDQYVSEASRHVAEY
jgi:hypothetical protein